MSKSAHRTLSRMVILAQLSIGLAAGADDSADRPPVLLRDTLLLAPVAVTGTGLTPEVKVQVDIDLRGRVAEVEVVSVKPTSEYDDIFRHNTIEELKQWRYAPAVRGGEPISATLEWTVQYKARQETSSSPSVNLLPSFLHTRADTEARHARILSLPLEKRKEILLRYARVAEKHLDRKRRRSFEAERFVVVTDAQEERTAEIVGHNLDVAVHDIARLLQAYLEPQPSRLKVLVYLYFRRSAFDAMRRELGRFTFGSATYYAPGLIVYHLDLPSTDFLMSLLIHETSHAYSDHFLRRPGHAFPSWLEEGFAEYMGNSQIKKGKLIPGRTLKRKYVMNHFSGGATLANTVSGWDLERIQRAIRRGEGLGLEELATAERDVFYGDKSHLYYGTAWLFVHFLRHGEPSWAEESFPRMMLYMAEGYPAKGSLEAAYGRPLGELEAPFREYVKGF